MNSIASRRTTCRLCDDNRLELVLPINASPIADAFVPREKLDEEQPLVPLDLYQCRACGHVQNLDIINPELLFRDYSYTTSSSLGLVDHFRRYSQQILNDFEIPPGSLAIEIGSNDGTLLKFFRDAGLRVQGVDPARDIARAASAAGIPTIAEYFNSALASRIKSEQGPARLFFANNVYAHADQLDDLTHGIALILDDDGIFVFEVSYLLDIIDKFVFDTIYHEHLSYHSIKPLVQFFAKHGLHLFDVHPIPTKGGSMRGFVQKAGGKQAERPIVQQMMREEARRGLHDARIYKEYGQRILQRKDALLAKLDQLRADGRKIVGYGASTTVTTLTYHFDLADRLEYFVDDNTKKHGLYSPGCHLEVKPSTTLYSDRPDAVVILAWQYAEPIIAKHAEFLAAGGEFIIPLPELRVVSGERTGSAMTSIKQPKRQSHLEFYKEHGISPVSYDVANLADHFDRRQSLYDKLGLPSIAFRGAAVLEVAAGTGHNSLYPAAQQPASLTLLEPNPAGLAQIRAVFGALTLQHTTPTVFTDKLEEFDPAQKFDIVLCENWLGTSRHELGLLSKLGGFLQERGVLVVTTISPIGFVPNLIRRFLAAHMAPPSLSFEERTDILKRAYGTHLGTMGAMTRSVTDWLHDNMLNPAYFGLCLSAPTVLNLLGEDFEVLCAYPAFVEDWRWFKGLYGEQRAMNRHFEFEYWKKAHNFLDHNAPSTIGSLPVNQALEEKAFELLRAIEVSEDAIIAGGSLAQADGAVASNLADFIRLLPDTCKQARLALQEVLPFVEQPGADNVSAIGALKLFSHLFGRETSYLSMQRSVRRV